MIETGDGARVDGHLLRHGDRLPVLAQHCRSSTAWRPSPASATTPATGRTRTSISPASGSASSAPAPRRCSRSRSSPQQAKHLFVFQRTPNYTVPAHNAPLDRRNVRARSRPTTPACARAPGRCTTGIDFDYNDALGAGGDAGGARSANTRRAGQRGGFSFIGAFDDLLVDQAANETAAEFVRGKIRETVHDPEVAELLSPRTSSAASGCASTPATTRPSTGRTSPWST